MRNLNKIWIFLISFLAFWIVSANAANLVYPTPIISKPNCRFDNFSDLTSDCKQNFPVLKTKDYNKLKDDYDLRRIYTVLWWATYTYWWDVWNWSHLWVDIATSRGTPVVSIADGTVIYAGAKTWWGNVVTVKHYINWKTIYSNYAHLSKVNTKYWTKLKAWDKLWEVWSTGNSTWNHLHFQIDTNSWDKSHPYYYFQNCPWDEWGVVNAWKCSSDMKNNTLDPLLFLETGWAIIKWWKIDKEKVDKIDKISQKDLTTVKSIQEREVRDFLRFYSVKLDFDSPTGNVPLWGTTQIHVRIYKKKNGKPFNGTLPGGFMDFIVNRDFVKILPNRLRLIENGKRDITLTWLKEGTSTLYIKIWTVQIKSKKLNIYNPKVKAKVNKVTLSVSSTVYLWEEKKWFAVFIDKNNIPLVDLPYSWEYKISASNALLCPFDPNTSNLWAEMSRTCWLWTYTNNLNLNYYSTYRWVPIFGIKAIDEGKNIALKIYDKWKNEVLAEKNIKVKLPKWIDIWYEYRDAVFDLLSKSIADWTGRWYFSEDRQIDEATAIKWIRNFVIYKTKNPENNTEKTKYTDALKKINWNSWSKYTKLSRGDMLDLIDKYIPKDYKKNAILYRDLSQSQSVSANKIFTKDYTWKDDFGAKYFQPKQALTRWEAAYMLYQAQF